MRRVPSVRASPRLGPRRTGTGAGRDVLGRGIWECRCGRYFGDWGAGVEKVGKEHSPEEARGHIYGSLQMTVVIDRNGALLDAIIDRSSGSPVLDRAARRIVK